MVGRSSVYELNFQKRTIKNKIVVKGVLSFSKLNLKNQKPLPNGTNEYMIFFT